MAPSRTASRSAPAVSSTPARSVPRTSAYARVSFAASVTVTGERAGPANGENPTWTRAGAAPALEILRSETKRAPNCPAERATAGIRRAEAAERAATNAPSFVESSTGVAHAATRPAPPVTRTSIRSAASGSSPAIP